MSARTGSGASGISTLKRRGKTASGRSFLRSGGQPDGLADAAITDFLRAPARL